MSPLRLGRAGVDAPAGDRLPAAAEALSAALAAGADELSHPQADRGRAVLAKADRRLSITGGHTVVALAGATGSGKSSLFNALVGAPVAEVGARRPTTALPTAAVWGDQPATALLDFLGVGRRHTVVGAGQPDGASADGASADRPPLDGLVLLDLPDFDSTAVAHRAEVDRVLDLVDVFVWVTDPQKYADARLHEDYVSRLAALQASTVVVLNQADRLTPEALAVCRADLERLLVADGVAAADVVVTSATTGAGVAQLVSALAEAVHLRTAAQARLLADVRMAAAALREEVGDTEVDVDAVADDGLVDALARAAGVPAIREAVERHYRREALGRAGWPFTRWARRLRPDPLRRLRLDPQRRGAPGELTPADVRSVLGRSSLPHASPAAYAGVDLATRALADRAGSALPVPWAGAVADAATPAGHDLTDALDQAVMAVSLRSRSPVWWTVFAVAQWVLAAAAVTGLVWLTALSILGFLQLPSIDPPRLGPLPYPFVLAVGGLLSGFLLGVVARALARTGARRRGAAVAARLRAAIGEVAAERIVAPVRSVVERHRRTRELLDTALR